VADLKGVVVRRGEGLEVLAGEAPPPEETVVENGLRFLANVRDGQKTGLFLDHRDHRALVRDVAGGLRVANLFSYVGGFSVHALAGGAREVWSVDVAAAALRDAERNVELNDLPAARHRVIEADVFTAVPEWVSAGERFELVVLDPPSLARSKRQRGRAWSAYRRLNADAARLVAPRGLLATASCTAQLAPDAFAQAVRTGLRDAGRSAQLVRRGGHGLDHPVRRSFPEGRYLKFLLLQMDA
jgi:23S rRNA (cytosine1962-C5)-methyltransferase